MELEEKLKILADCDFSKWRQVRRDDPVKIKELDNSFYVTGFGNVLAGMHGAIGLLSQDSSKNEYLEYLENSYQFLQECYGKIPFEKLDKNDEDFGLLFEYRDKLDNLGILLDEYLAKAENEKSVPKESKEYKQIIDNIDDMFSRDYREEVLKKYGLDT